MSCTSYLSYLSSNNWSSTCGGISIFICLTASIENIVILVTFACSRSLHTETNGLLASLAVSDLLVGVVLAPLHALQLLSPEFLNDCVVDETRRYLSTLLIGASAFTIGGISYDRYLHMSKLMNYNKYMSKMKATLMISACWMIPAVIPIFRYIFKSQRVYFIALIVAIVLILGTLLACYVLIVMSLINRGKCARLNKKCEMRQMRTLKTVALILTTFLFMILPIFVHHIVFVGFPRTHIRTKVELYIVGQTLAMLNSSANPIIYYFRNPEFRANLNKLLRFKVRQKCTGDQAMEMKCLNQ